MFLRTFLALLALLVPASVSAQDGSPIVGIAQMNDLTGMAQAENFSQMLETALISSGKFRIIERSRLSALLEEQGLARGGVTTTNQPGRTGGFEGVDYLIYGSITQISAVNRSDFGASLTSALLGGSRSNPDACYNTRVRLEADIRITDTNTGEVRYASRISEEQQSAPVCGGGTQIDSSALLRSAADNIATGLTTTIFPIQVAAIQGGGILILNYGEGAVRKGDYLMIYGEAMEIPDPSGTGMIRIDGEQIGAIQITEVQSAFSRARMVTQFPVPPAVGTIARRVDKATVDALTREQRRNR